MTTAGPLTIGFMAPTTRTRPHFASFLRIVPMDVTIAFGDLGIVRRSLTDLADRMDAILATTAAGVRDGGWDAVAGRFSARREPRPPEDTSNANIRGIRVIRWPRLSVRMVANESHERTQTVHPQFLAVTIVSNVPVSSVNLTQNTQIAVKRT